MKLKNYNLLRANFELFFIKSFYIFVPLLSRKQLLLLASFFGKISYYIDKRGQKTALENTKLIFQNTQKNQKKISQESYSHFTRNILELFWSKRINKKNHKLLYNFEIEDEKNFNKGKKKGAIWITPHYSNFEGLSFVWGLNSINFHVIAEDFKNPKLTKFFTNIRQKSGNKIISQNFSLLRLIKHIKNGGHTALLTDLTVQPKSLASIINCFNYKTSVTHIHALLAKKFDFTIIPTLCIPKKNGQYKIKVYKEITAKQNETLQEITQKCWDTFEKDIKKNPAPWLWMYKHWRYKPKNSTKKYPSYSNHKKDFEKLLNKQKNKLQ